MTKLGIYALGASLILSGQLHANEQFNLPRSSMSFRAGSAGWGVEYKTRIQDELDFRLVWQTLAPGRFNIDTNGTTTSMYQGRGHFRSSGIISDWYPWTTPIRFSFGIFQNGSRFQLTEAPSLSSPQNQYEAHYGKLAYFFGTGWAPRQNPHKLTLTLDVGLLAQQPPQVTWVADSTVRTPAETVRIWTEKSKVAEELEQFKILPFFMIGLSYTL